MHKILRENLPRANGESDLVVAIFLDVRGFTSFAGNVESANAALFLRSVYSRILDEYFPEVTFFKLTGDGMMIIRKYGDDNLVEIVNDSVRKSIALVEAFPTLCQGDIMINFPTPLNLGIGIARDAATRLGSEGYILDYSGRPLNLAARLMEFARPSGVVFNATSMGLGVIEEELLAQFSEDHVYVKSIAENSPLSIHYLTSRTRIEEASHIPINKFKTKVAQLEDVTGKIIEGRGHYFHELPEKPDLINNCKIFFGYPSVDATGAKHPTDTTWIHFSAPFHTHRGAPGITLEYSFVNQALVAERVKPNWKIPTYIEYDMADYGSE